MNSEISSVAKSRARYYCKGAPVQFVQVELLRINENNNMIVTLTFKNIAPQRLTGFMAHFRCKGMTGAVVMEDNFTYENLNVGEGELFGSDDAVFVSEEPLSSVEVSLVQVEYGPNLRHNLQRCQPVPLPLLKQLSVPAAQAANAMLQIDSVRYMPVNVADGWQCSCGAFNYNIGQSKERCTECSVPKALLLGAVRAVLESEAAGELLAAPVRAAVSQSAPAQHLPGMADWDDVGSAPQSDGYDAMGGQGYDDAMGGQGYDDAMGGQGYDDASYGSMGYDDRNDLGSMDELSALEDAIPASARFDETAQYDKFTDYDTPGSRASRYDENARTAVLPSQRGGDSVALMQTSTADFIMKFAPFITLGASIIYVGALLLINLLL